MQNNTTATSKLLDAQDLLSKTEKMVSFVQSITLINSDPESDLTLDNNQVTGLYYVLNNVIDNLSKVGEKIQSAKLEINNHA